MDTIQLFKDIAFGCSFLPKDSKKRKKSQNCKKNKRQCLKETNKEVQTKNDAVKSVKQELLFVGNESGKLLSLKTIMREGYVPPVLLFVQSKKQAEKLYLELKDKQVGMIHADVTQAKKDSIVKHLIEGKLSILICSELIASEIDFSVNLVLNFDFPTTAISYIHRIGYGERAITYFTTDDVNNLLSIADDMKNAGCDIPDYIMKFGKAPKKQIYNKEKEETKERKYRV